MTEWTMARFLESANIRAYRAASVLMLILSGLLAYRINGMRDESSDLQGRRSQLLTQMAATLDQSKAPRVMDRVGTTSCGQASPFKVLDEIARQRQLVIESGSVADFEHQAQAANSVQIHARGSYIALRQVLRGAALQLPCLSLDSIDLHRDKALDQQLIAEARVTFYAAEQASQSTGPANE